jgi:hypothetical protein
LLHSVAGAKFEKVMLKMADALKHAPPHFPARFLSL